MEYAEDDFLLVSGIQHFVFYRRQWALIQNEAQWQDNELTLAGQALHQKADQPELKESRGNKLIVRAMPIHSRELGLVGICDVVEMIKDPAGTTLHGHAGKYRPVPVEYKHGQPKADLSDKLQLLAEAWCLEEMLGIKIASGELYYLKTKRREHVVFDEPLRDRLKEVCNEMHQLWQRRYVPRVKVNARCNRCSLKDICLPEMLKRESVATYLKRMLAE